VVCHRRRRFECSAYANGVRRWEYGTTVFTGVIAAFAIVSERLSTERNGYLLRSTGGENAVSIDLSELFQRLEIAIRPHELGGTMRGVTVRTVKHFGGRREFVRRNLPIFRTFGGTTAGRSFYPCYTCTRGVKNVVAVSLGRTHHPRRYDATDDSRHTTFQSSISGLRGCGRVRRLEQFLVAVPMVTSEMLATSLTSFWVTFSLVNRAAAYRPRRPRGRPATCRCGRLPDEPTRAAPGPSARSRRRDRGR